MNRTVGTVGQGKSTVSACKMPFLATPGRAERDFDLKFRRVVVAPYRQ